MRDLVEREWSGYPINNRSDYGITWGYANRGAHEICIRRGYTAGLYTGHQSGEWMGIHCFADGSGVWMDIPGWEVRSQSGWNISSTDPNKLYPMNANVVGTSLCMQRGYGAGFMNGHHDPGNDLYGVVCTPAERTGEFLFKTDTAPHFWSWVSHRLTALGECNRQGFATGVIMGYVYDGPSRWHFSRVKCFR